MTTINQVPATDFGPQGSALAGGQLAMRSVGLGVIPKLRLGSDYDSEMAPQAVEVARNGLANGDPQVRIAWGAKENRAGAE